MELIAQFLSEARSFLPLLMTMGLVVGGLFLIDRFLSRRWRDDLDAQFRFQMIMLALTLAGGLAVVIALPISDTLRGQLLSLLGILLSAAIALSATTFIGNMMAGIMLKVIKSVRPGDFITVSALTGRVTRMDLLHVEVQTEDRDLVTLPNLYMVTQPMKVTRASGTIVSAEVSLGYDVSRIDVSNALHEAAGNAGLSDAFVQVRDLGDFSVLYRVAGLLEETKNLISKRSELRESMLDSLHNAGIEIVSPSFMTTRALADNERYIPKPSRIVEAPAKVTTPEEVAFDKADQAASVESIRQAIHQVEADLESLKTKAPADASVRAAELESDKKRLLGQLEIAEERRLASDRAERSGSGSRHLQG